MFDTEEVRVFINGLTLNVVSQNFEGQCIKLSATFSDLRNLMKVSNTDSVNLERPFWKLKDFIKSDHTSRKVPKLEMDKNFKVPKLKMDKDFKVFNDPIHGNIRLHPLCVKIIDTPQFQRLRFIKQLGGTYFVYPGAAHNRFEHSIGTCYLAGKLVKSLREKLNERDDLPEELKISPKDELCVQIAALCHDLGHGPFSHVFDRHVVPKLFQDTDINWMHEQGSIDMLDHMFEDQELDKECKKYGINDDDRAFIKNMILGGPKDKNKSNHGRSKEKKFLYEIVSNERNKIDVDKWDYFARDCHMLGFGNNFNLERCIDFSRVVNVQRDENGEQVDDWQICYRDKEAANLYDMFYTRYVLHRRAYQHKTTNVIELMLTEALVKAKDFLKFPGKDGEYTMREVIENKDMMAYCQLTDDIILQILRSRDERLNPSKTIIENILKRKIYAFVGEERCKHGEFRDVDAVADDIENVTGFATKEKIVIDLVKLDYGMKDRNPIEKVNFYEKKNPDFAKPREKKDVSLLLPKDFAEQLVRVYCRNPEHFDEVEGVFKEWSQNTTRLSSANDNEESCGKV